MRKLMSRNPELKAGYWPTERKIFGYLEVIKRKAENKDALPLDEVLSNIAIDTSVALQLMRVRSDDWWMR
jgi:hypothetical protein